MDVHTHVILAEIQLMVPQQLQGANKLEFMYSYFQCDVSNYIVANQAEYHQTTHATNTELKYV